MKRILNLLIGGVSLSAISGCITLYHKTDVVRSSEARRSIQFENPQAADSFQTAFKKHPNSHVGGSRLGVPFVTLFAKNIELSESAAWNDAVVKCDTNQDGMITSDEALIYAKAFEN